MKYAIFKIAGKQYKATEGEELEVEKIEAKKEAKLKSSEVLLLVDKDKFFVGQPYIKDASVSFQVVDQFKGEKIRVAKFKAKSRYRKVKGHRQKLTKVKILKISLS